MPEISALGWFHTAMGVIALVSGGYTLVKAGEITLQSGSGRVYLAATFITAATALAIFQRGEFGPGHALAVLTALALAIGIVADTTKLFGGMSRYVRAVSYSSTLLFHCIPAVTDGLMRLPAGKPVVTSFDDPLLRNCYLAFVVLFLIGITLQLRWIHTQRS